MKVIVIYKSKTGFTKKYAEWIAEALEGDICEVSRVKIDMLEDYDTVIYGGSLHAVGIIGVKFITKNTNKLKGKKLVVFATGASLPEERVVNDVLNNNFTPEQREYIKFFYLRGGFDYGKLSLFDKLLMSLMKKHINNKVKQNKELAPDERGMLTLFEKSVDFTEEGNIADLIEFVKS